MRSYAAVVFVSMLAVASGQGSSAVTCGHVPSSACECPQPTNGMSGTITDGAASSTAPYPRNVACRWLIAVPSGVNNGVVELTFTAFDTELDYDFVTISRCTTTQCSARDGMVQEVAKLSGNAVNLATIYSTGTTEYKFLQVEFKTDEEMSAHTGFIASWAIRVVVPKGSAQPYGGPTTKSGELFEDATWGPEGSSYIVVALGFFVIEDVVLTIRNAIVICESETCLSIRGKLIMNDSFIGKKTTSRYTNRQSTTAIQHNNGVTASSIQLQNVTIRSVVTGVKLACCGSRQRTEIRKSVIDDVGVGIIGWPNGYDSANDNSWGYTEPQALIENTQIMYSDTGVNPYYTDYYRSSPQWIFVNVLFYRNGVGHTQAVNMDTGNNRFLRCMFIENDIGLQGREWSSNYGSLDDVIFQKNKVAMDNFKGSMSSVTLYQNDLAIRSSKRWDADSWSRLNFISNSVNIEYTATSSSSIVGAYWGQCADVSCIQGLIKRTDGAGVVLVSSFVKTPNCQVTFPCTCGAGYGGDAGTVTCTECVTGKYKSAAVNGNCTDCGAGKYGIATGQTSESSCMACGSGKYREGTGGSGPSSCTDCGAGKYGNATGQTSQASCTACPEHSNSPSRSSSRASCSCNRGYGGDARSETCAACVAGKYKTPEVNDNCTDCDTGKYGNAPGQIAEASCKACAVGKYGSATGQTAESSCTVCGAGKYGVACRGSCPTNSNSPAGSSSLSDCTCNSGSTGPDGGTCTQCVAGKFKATQGSATCDNCLVGQYSGQVGASKETSCFECAGGKYASREGASTCSDCEAGKSSEGVGAYRCISCSAGKYSSTASAFCRVCQVNCTCDGGYGGDAYRGSCTSCVAGKYKSAAGNDDCTACSAGKYGVATGQTAEASCTDCGAGKYRVETGASGEASCTVCTPNSNSPPQSSARAACTCNAGYGGDAGTGTCTACVAGKWKSEGDNGICTDCVAGKYGDSTGQTAEASCTACGAGKYLVEIGGSGEASCTACIAGKYRVGTGGSVEASCTTCTANSNSPTQSSAPAACRCDVGYTGPNGGTCTACVAGKYKTSTGSANCTDCGAGTYSTAVTVISTCITCPTNSNSPAGSSALTSCTCNAGSWGTDGGLCTACTAGTYKTSTGSALCSDCGAGTYSMTLGGSACVECDAGKYKETQGSSSCSTCDVGKFSGQVGAFTEKTCIECTGGKFAGREGATACLHCEAGKSSEGGAYRCSVDTGTATTQPTPAPAPTASPPPSLNALVVIEVTITIPFTKASFTAEKQLSFRSAVAATAIVPAENVIIASVKEVSTRRAATSLEITTQIHVKDGAAASSLMSSWDTKMLNTHLRNQGIPEAMSVSQPQGLWPVKSSSKAEIVSELVRKPVGEKNGSFQSDQAVQLPVIIGSVVGAVVLLCILAGCYYFRCCQPKNPADDAHLTSHVENGSTPAPQLTPARQPQHQHKPLEPTPLVNLTVGSAYSVPSEPANLLADVRWGEQVFPENKAQEQVLRVRRSLVVESKAQEAVANEPTEDSDVFKISLSDLDVLPKSLASGTFKEVFLARLRKTIPEIGPAGHKVAVMKLRNGNSTLGAELKVFKMLGRHANLTRLYAVTCSDLGAVTSLVTEFAELGSLDHVLNDLSEGLESATADVLLTAAMQVLDGMLQLQEHTIVHCDLALRNILVFRFDASDCDQVHVKITDYGLASTGTYVQVSTSSVGDGVPFRWMPPESILRRRWSEKSDVWAFAVTVWEMFTHGLVPYTFISSDSEVGQRVIAGHRLERPMTPTECPPGVFGVMLKCWEQDTKARPTFAEVKRMILSEFRVGRQGECCICLERKLLSDLMALVPCGHRCVCAHHASHIVGHPCPMCRAQAIQAIRVFD